MILSHVPDVKRDCSTCNLRRTDFLCHLSPAASEMFMEIKHTMTYPTGTVLFLDNEDARGLMLVCSGKIKLSFSSSAGKTLVLRITKPGDVLGLTAVMSSNVHEVTAEVLEPTQVTFIHKEDFQRFVRTYPEVYGSVIGQISAQYKSACEQLRTVGLSTSANEKLARLILDWSKSDGVETTDGTRIRVPWTHEQIAECVGSTRETVSRTLGDFKVKHLITVKGATMMIPNRAALAAVGGC